MKRMGNKKYIPLVTRFDHNKLWFEVSDWRLLDNVSTSSFKIIGYFDKPSLVEGVGIQIDLLFQISKTVDNYSVYGFALEKNGADLEAGETAGYSVWINFKSNSNDFGIWLESPNYKTAFAGANFHGYVVFDEIDPKASFEIGLER